MALRREPVLVDDNNWYYEERRGICCVHQIKDFDGNVLATDQFYIPWKKLLESVRRKYPEKR